MTDLTITLEEDGNKGRYVARLPGSADYERVHREVLSALPGVARLHSSFTIRQVFSRTQVPVAEGTEV